MYGCKKKQTQDRLFYLSNQRKQTESLLFIILELIKNPEGLVANCVQTEVEKPASDNGYGVCRIHECAWKETLPQPSQKEMFANTLKGF